MALDPNPKETAMTTTHAPISFKDSTPEEIEAYLTQGHGGDRLRHVFGIIQDPTNWKLPVHAVLTPSVQSITEAEILASIDFMVGGQGAIEVQPNGDRLVTAPGYYALIGS